MTWSKSDLDGRKVCIVLPLGVSENVTLIVDAETVNYEDLKASMALFPGIPLEQRDLSSYYLRIEHCMFQRSALITCYQNIMFLLDATTPTNPTTSFTVRLLISKVKLICGFLQACNGYL